jgi:small subunit ribosomal protein S21
MLRIIVQKGEQITRALKRYKQKVRNTKLTKEVRERKEYIKPSAKKRRAKQKAIKTREYREKNGE